MFCGACLDKGFLTRTKPLNGRGVVGHCHVCDENVMSMTSDEVEQYISDMCEFWQRLQREFINNMKIYGEDKPTDTNKCPYCGFPKNSSACQAQHP